MQMKNKSYIEFVKAILQLLDGLQKDARRDGRISLSTAQRAATLTLFLGRMVQEVDELMLEEKVLELKAAEHELVEAQRRAARSRPTLAFSNEP